MNEIGRESSGWIFPFTFALVAAESAFAAVSVAKRATSVYIYRPRSPAQDIRRNGRLRQRLAGEDDGFPCGLERSAPALPLDCGFGSKGGDVQGRGASVVALTRGDG